MLPWRSVVRVKEMTGFLQPRKDATPSRRAIELAVMALLAAVALGFGIRSAGLASAYVDPFLHAHAQDEAVYGHAAASMVRTGQWLTPVFLHRLMLNKPPLLFWMGALSMRLLGVGPVVLRLTPILAGVFCCLLAFCWLRQSQSFAAAASGVVLLLSNAVFHSMARTFMTDILLTLLVTAAIFVLARDPRLERWRSVVFFGLSTGAAIMTKSAAGILPLLVFLIYFLLRPDARPQLQRLIAAAAIAALVAAPWHLYQLLVHRDWFLAEYVRFQLIGTGITAPSRYSSDSGVAFYLRTLFEMDPLLFLLACLAVPGLVAAWNRQRKETDARLLTAWSIGAFAVLLVFGTRVAYYLLPLIPALVLISVRFSPLFRGRWAAPACALLLCAFGLKAWQADAPFGINYRSKTVPSAAALENYSRLRRVNDLLIVAPDDDFYSSTLDLPKVRYVYPGTVDPAKTSGFFYTLGVNLSTDEFCHLAPLLPLYQQRLAAWGDPHPDAAGIIIAAQSSSDVPDLVHCSPNSDFFIPDELRDQAVQAGRSTHTAGPRANGRFFLLANNSQQRPADAHAAGAIIALAPKAELWRLRLSARLERDFRDHRP